MAIDSVASQFDLAVLGADAPLGEAVLAILDEREVAIGQLFALTLTETDSSVGFRGATWPCLDAAEFDYSQAQALIVAGRGTKYASTVERIRMQRPTMPIITADVLDPAAAVIAGASDQADRRTGWLDFCRSVCHLAGFACR